MPTALGAVEPSCAICGAPPEPECPHESERLKLALHQALSRWSGLSKIRTWVLNHARNSVLSDFGHMKRARYRAHVAYLQTLPCFSLYEKYHGHPPLNPSQLQNLEAQIHHAREIYKTGVDDDWRRSCLTYPTVLDYFFELVEIDFPDDDDVAVQEPEFGGPVRPQRAVKARRGSTSRGSGTGSHGRQQQRKKDRQRRRRRSRGRTPTGMFDNLHI